MTIVVSMFCRDFEQLHFPPSPTSSRPVLVRVVLILSDHLTKGSFSITNAVP